MNAAKKALAGYYLRAIAVGKIIVRPVVRRYHYLAARHAFMRTLWFRVVSVVLAVTLALSPLYALTDALIRNASYRIASQEAALIGKSTVSPQNIKQTDSGITYNRAEDRGLPNDVQRALTIAASKNDSGAERPYQVELPNDAADAIKFADSQGSNKLTLTPLFRTDGARLVDDRVIYPAGANQKHVYTFKNNGIKNDIILSRAPMGNTKTFSWRLGVGSGLTTKLLPNGGVGVYSSNALVRGDSRTTGGDESHLVFELPRPFILDSQNNTNYQDVSYSLNGDTLTLTAINLRQQAYPLTIDPTIVVNTTAGFQQNTGDVTGADLVSTANQLTRATSGVGMVGASTTNASSFSSPRASHTTVTYNGYLYIIGGDTGTPQSDIQYCPINANGSVGTCTTNTTGFTTARNSHTSVVYNGYLYIIGGWDATNDFNDIQYCPINTDGSVGTCTQQTNAFTTARRGHTTVTYNGYLYIIGGRQGTTNLNDIQYCPINANGSVGTCTTNAGGFTTARTEHSSVIYNGYLYVIGGTNGTQQGDVQYCQIKDDGSVGTCTTNASGLTTARSEHSSVVYGGYLYIIGGTNGTVQNDVEYLPFNVIAAATSYERVIDVGAGGSMLMSFTINGVVACANYTVAYRIGDVNGAYGAVTSVSGVKPGVAQSLGQVTGRYVLLRIGMDDSSCSGAKSSISSIGVLYDAKPAAPTLLEPIGGMTGVRVSPEFRLGSTDMSNDYLRYKIQVCTDNACNSILRTVDQTVSQQGWLAQSQQAGTAYTGGVPTQMAIHQYQPAPLAAGTQYWWRGAAIDTGGTNQWSDWSGTATFTTAPAAASGISIGGGGVSINGGTTITTGN